MKIVWSLTLLAATAAAQPASDPGARARELYAEGKRYYDTGDYDRAIEAWKQAYVASAAPMLLFNIAQAHRLGGDCAMAMKVYASYEREAGQVTNREELEAARSRCLREPTATNPPGEVAPTAPPLVAPPQTPPLTVAAPLSDEEPPARPPAVDRGRPLRTAGLVAGSAGVALLGVSALFAWRAADRADQVAAYRGEWTSAEVALEDEGRTARTLSITAGVVGVAAVATGATLYLLGRRPQRDATRLSLSPTSVELTWRASF